MRVKYKMLSGKYKVEKDDGVVLVVDLNRNVIRLLCLVEESQPIGSHSSAGRGSDSGGIASLSHPSLSSDSHSDFP